MTATSKPGIFLFKLPGLRGRGPPLVAIEINPVDSSGSATKKRGIVIRSGSELEEISRLLTNFGGGEGITNTVSVIDGKTNKVVANVTVGSSPHSVAVNPTTDMVYVTNDDNGTVS